MILDKIVKSTHIRVEKCKEEISFDDMKILAQKSKTERQIVLSSNLLKEKEKEIDKNVLPPFAFENALKNTNENPDKRIITSRENANNENVNIDDAIISKISNEYNTSGLDIFGKHLQQKSEIDNPETVNSKSSQIAFICEVKKASPSKGILSENFDYLEIAKQYEMNGASAISVLTEPEFFLGSKAYLTEIKKQVKIPVLQKDFIIDEYQIYEASVIGADAILLICAILDVETIGKFIKIADSLGLSCLVETRNETEIKSAINAGARVIGVNNRDLQTFEVDVNTSIMLRGKVPKEIVFVSESGIKTNADVQKLSNSGIDAVLIGETLMKSSDIKAELVSLKGLKIERDS